MSIVCKLVLVCMNKLLTELQPIFIDGNLSTSLLIGNMVRRLIFGIGFLAKNSLGCVIEDTLKTPVYGL
jgi:hypothetical protein